MDLGARIRMSRARGATVKMGSEGSLAALLCGVHMATVLGVLSLPVLSLDSPERPSAASSPSPFCSSS